MLGHSKYCTDVRLSTREQSKISDYAEKVYPPKGGAYTLDLVLSKWRIQNVAAAVDVNVDAC